MHRVDERPWVSACDHNRLAVAVKAIDLLRRTKTASCQDERLDAIASNSCDLLATVTEPLVLAENREVSSSTHLQPFDVGDLRVTKTEDLMVSAKPPAADSQGVSELMASEATVYEELRRRQGERHARLPRRPPLARRSPLPPR